MSNIFDYLEWRGDLSFSADPFNDVDNVVLSELSYTDFDGVVPGPGEGFLSVGEVCRRYFARHTAEEIMSRSTFYKTAAFLMKPMETSERFGSMQIGGYINEVQEQKGAQISAVTFLLGDGSAYIAFRGTDDTIAGWKEDLTFSYKSGTVGQKRAAEYTSQMLSILPEDMRIRIGGHSKGGNFAVYAGMCTEALLGERLACVYSNDGPGFLSEVTKSEAFRKLRPKVRSTIPEYSVVGVLLKTVGGHHIIHSDENGPMQHNALSWQVLGNRFVEAKRSKGSLFFDESVRAWIKGLDDGRKKEWVDTLFSFFDTAGIGTLTDLREHSVQNGIKLLKAMWDLPKEEQVRFLEVIFRFTRVSREILSEEARTELQNYLEELKGGEENLTGVLREAFLRAMDRKGEE